MKQIALLHGCNLNMLGQRDPEHYGTLTLPELIGQVVDDARKFNLQCVSFQTNHEGELIEKIHELRLLAAGMIINPGAWTHYSYGIRDALEMVEGPIVEVHLSDIEHRSEEWRRHSVIRDVCDHMIAGRGAEGYRDAVAWLAQRL